MGGNVKDMRSYFSVVRSFLVILFFLGFPFSALAAGKLVLAIDGLSFATFQAAQNRGLFKSFLHSGRHIAPYPSMTEPSWTEILGGKTLFPYRGNIKTIESKYFDLDTFNLADDPRNLFVRYANPYNYVRAFDYAFSPYLETLMYLPNRGLVQLELKELETEIYQNFNPEKHFIAYVSSVDATAHTKKDQLYPLLVELDETILRIEEKYRKEGKPIEIWLVSDHGNIGAFLEGAEETYLQTFSLRNSAAQAGLTIVEGKLTQAHEISIPVMALGNMANVYFKDLTYRRSFALQTLKNPEVDLVTYFEMTPSGERYVTVLGSESEARIYWQGKSYAYLPLHGNPLQIEPALFSTPGSLKWVPDSIFSEATQHGPYPDSVFRIAQSALKQVSNPPDLIVNLKDGYCFEGEFSEYVKMVRTHGSLTAGSSLGIVASNSKPVPEFLRSEAILRWIGLSSKEAFHRVKDFFHESPSEVLKRVESSTPGIQTQINDYSQGMIFLRLTKWVSASLDLLPLSDLKEILSTARKLYSESLSHTQGDLYRLIQTFIGKFTQENSREILNEFDFSEGLLPAFQNRTDLHPETLPLNTSTVDLVRKTGMKLYTLPFLMNEILTLPEFETETDPRDLNFAHSWFEKKRREVFQDPLLLSQDSKLASQLFSEIFTERKLLSSLSPATFPLLYNPASQEITVVFIPGIYNELFDTEIFSRGLRALREQLGLRVIYAPVDGRCSSRFNSRVLYQFLKEDTVQRMNRGHVKPHYVLLGYSKGGVDATEALLVDRSFTRSQILALVSIASPHYGSSILKTADLPSFVTQTLIQRPLPPECHENRASQSLLPANRENFWANHLKDLVGLTRFYSVSFVSRPENSHPWMKAAKIIGKFKTPNDGVVTLESSHFPEALSATDFGAVEADHLAGILASAFPQGPFLEAILLSLLETRSLTLDKMQKWYASLEKNSPHLKGRYHRRAILSSLQDSASAQLMALTGDAELVSPSEPGKSPEDKVWYEPFQRLDQFSKNQLICMDDESFDRITSDIKTSLENSRYRVSPFLLRCEQLREGSPIVLKIQVPYNWFQLLTENPRYNDYTVRTVEDVLNTLLAKGLLSGKDLLEEPAKLLPIPNSNRPPLVLPQSNFEWKEDLILDLFKLPSLMKEVKVSPLSTTQNTGLRILFDHQTVRDFRKEYRFSFESTSPGGIEDHIQGYYASRELIRDREETVLKMRSEKNSIRMTSFAFRFPVFEFPNFFLLLKVNEGLQGANPGVTRLDDSAFQVWFALKTPKEEIKLFGYYWGDKNTEGVLTPGDIIENGYSFKKYPLIPALPEAKQLFLEGGVESEKQWKEFRRNFQSDLKRAFVKSNDVERWEVVAITFQTDSKDLGKTSEAVFKEMSLTRH
jgi:hypothetical protein